VTFTRASDLTTTHREIQAAVATDLSLSDLHCNMNKSAPRDSDTTESTQTRFSDSAALGVHRSTKTKKTCPFSHRANGQMPPNHPAIDTADSDEDVHVYEHCYNLNAATGYQIAWDFNNDTQTIDVSISAKALPGVGNTWIALGIDPTFPAMSSADIVAGFIDTAVADGLSCVAPMYSEACVGAPSANTNMTIRDWSAVSVSGRVEVRFTRDFKSGHTDVGPRWDGSRRHVMWAMGPVSQQAHTSTTTTSACGDVVSRMGYHSGSRGYRVWSWDQPETVVPRDMKCTKLK